MALCTPSGWRVEDGHFVRDYSFPDFKSALAFVNRVGEIAEELNHHPDVELGWGRIRLTVWSHDVNALTERDMKFADRVNALDAV